ncbi:MAG: polysaccharide lyase [Clostridia bacterium]|nr:polysaccharide lyase [Clostridia bacterium]
MKNIAKTIITILVILFCISGCAGKRIEVEGKNRTVNFSFETVEEFSNYYIVPQDYKNTTHSLSTEQVYKGNYSHKAWITGAYDESTIFTNNNHRAYPTIQLHKDTDGAFVAPCLITLYLWADMVLKPHSPENQWLSFATFTGDASDNWLPVVCVNLSYDGYVHLMHVPTQGKSEYIYQNAELTFPMREWVQLQIYFDNRVNGYIKVWQNGVLVSHAALDNGNGLLSQAHFGLYAAPSVDNGVIYNDDLTISEVSSEKSVK